MRRVLLLGAGASYGHGATDDAAWRPPHAFGFFTHPLSTELLGKYATLVEYSKEFCGFDPSHLSRSNGVPDIEELFSRVETYHLQRYSWRERLEKFGKLFVFADPVVQLQSYIVDLIYLSTAWLHDVLCPYHKFLVEEWLSPGETVISFNYDLIVDCALKQLRDWSEPNGYGFHATNLKRDRARGDAKIIRLLKPHGSLNWYKRIDFLPTQLGNPDSPREEVERITVLPLEHALRGWVRDIESDRAILGFGRVDSFQESLLENLDSDGYDFDFEFKMARLAGVFGDKNPLVDRMNDSYRPLMIMPTPYKSIEHLRFGELKDTWINIEESVSSCDELLAVGFSFRDSHFNQVLRAALRGKESKILIHVVTKSEKDYLETCERLHGLKAELIPHVGGLARFVAEHAS